MKLRIVHKMLLAFLASGILVTVVAGFIIERQLKADHFARIEAEMMATAQIVSLMPQSRILRFTDVLAESSGCRLTLIDVQGKILADSNQQEQEGEADNHFDRSEIQEARLKGKGMAVRYSRTLKQEMIYVAVRFGSVGYVRLARPIREVTDSLAQVQQTAFLALVLIICCSLCIALFFSLRGASRLKRLAAFSERIRQGNAVGTFRSEAHDEIGILAENINAMVAALQEKIRLAQEERKKLESVFTGMTEGVMILDPMGRIETINRRMGELTGLDSEKATGRTLLEAFRNPLLHDALERFRQTGESLSQEILLSDNPPLIVEVIISAVPGVTEPENKAMFVFHDVTRLKQLERVRTDFVANVTHEIRTPLTAIIGFVETLQKGAFKGRDTLPFLDKILNNAQRLNRLVDDLLNLLGVELGKAKLCFEKLSLTEVLPQVLELVAAQVSAKGLQLVQNIPGELPPIIADRDRLLQILLNLLDNAVKFTPEGGTITIAAEPTWMGQLIIRISDTGVGIPKKEIPRLGERFYRADKARSRELGGTGLGLSIVKHLMQAHRGKIEIDSTLGHGTTITLYFPIDEGCP